MDAPLLSTYSDAGASLFVLNRIGIRSNMGRWNEGDSGCVKVGDCTVAMVLIAIIARLEMFGASWLIETT